MIIIDALAMAKIPCNDGMIRKAAERFLGKTGDEITAIIASIVEGHARKLLGTSGSAMILSERDTFAARLLEVAGADLNAMGISFDSFIIRDVSAVHE